MSAAKKDSPETYNFERKFEKCVHNMFWIKENDFQKFDYDEGKIEYFGVLRISFPLDADKKLWYLYYSKGDKLNETLDKIRRKFGKKQVFEIFRQPAFSGIDVCVNVKKHFKERSSWRTQGNIIEASPKSHYTDERIFKIVTKLCNYEREKLYNFVCINHDWYKRGKAKRIQKLIFPPCF